MTLAVPPRGLCTGGETRHQQLQRTLAERERGAPLEQIRSAPSRMRHTRSCAILHSSLEEPLMPYKSLEPRRPQWQGSFRRYHETQGYRVLDQDTIVVSARDMLQKTKMGLLRSSSGTVTYSHAHKLKVEMDVEMLTQVLGDGPPGGGHMWTPRKLEWIFKERTGRSGCWVDYDIGIKVFLSLFPRTFEFVGSRGEFVTLKRKATVVLDDAEDAMVRLARARETGCVEPFVVADGTTQSPLRSLSLPQLKTNRLKAVYVLTSGPSRGQSMQDSHEESTASP